MFELLVLFASTLTAHNKSSFGTSENLWQPIQLQLSKKHKCFSNFLLHFWNTNQNLNISEKKMTLIAYVFPKSQTPKHVVGQISKKPRFRTPFNSQHAKASQTLLKAARHHFYYIFPSLWGK